MSLQILIMAVVTEHMDWNGAQWNGTYCMYMEHHSMEHGTHGMERSTMERNILHVYGTIIFDYRYSLDREMSEIHG